MKIEIEKYKGIHPGAVIERELKKRNLAQRPFALSLLEYPQTFNAIIKGKRGVSTALALKIENALDLEEGTLSILQVYYDIKKEKQKSLKADKPNISILRKSLFWDTNIDSINWQDQSSAVIKRIFERGNFSEKKEIINFYGIQKVKTTLIK
ncbi:plasmid maintenance system antidote protein [Flavobacterium sp. MC2016-06]|uniref:helix-turn-helix transcriptional regulator n=1 Tax=Flavobacterium sp. MC2016-06 TaxID=2676308 RepID=UPI001327CD82|nr:plasmid maintenance system antidote protein [Flavobacterium sp. MC2016-06]MBU3861694.1 plasmid maintenance system antidote protein [Flavobacterium sp. MC2016-06]